MNRYEELPEEAWYLVQCKPRQEARALEHLDRQGFECFYPSVGIETTLKAGKTRHQEQPLFPGYLFIHLGLHDNWSTLRSTRGVNRIVGFCNRPCRVNDSIIEHLRQRCALGGSAGIARDDEKGIQTKAGPLAEMDAIFLSMDGEKRVMLLLNMLDREQQAQVRLASLRVNGVKSAA
ncbi:transcription/translation regulatory transformer protein RfaH [Azomonas macrocytogenes]|uniref:Transcriptional antiterminator RfaH n=1 Tax=Azomonas macrocytogenes TaxID=69962 RepID=A0A839T8F8_AZOMA|nr:transcription/translation regulatory transformer protein RfaH [Azomonas macrocytogenes]MBB3104275.1 transcriptional antiterminator RfaH [Azomonas macrocytogenes]